MIVRVEKSRITSRSDWNMALRTHRSGKVSVSVIRDKREQVLPLTLPARKSNSDESEFFEYEMPEFNLGMTFNYAEMAALIAPRPFMVERGHDDTVGTDEMVAYEFARVRQFYDRLGIGDRAQIEFFNGPHTIHGVGTFEFLQRHLGTLVK